MKVNNDFTHFLKKIAANSSIVFPDSFRYTQKHPEKETLWFFLLLIFYMNKEKNSVVFVADNENELAYTKDLFEAVFNPEAKKFFLIDNIYLHIEENFFNELRLEERWRALKALAENEKGIFLVSKEALRFNVATNIKNSFLKISNGDILEREQLLTFLANADFSRNYQVQDPGEFAVRGDIVDVYTLGSPNPVRIEFSDNEVQSVRYFDIISQKTVAKCEEITIYPFTDIVSNCSNNKKIKYFSDDNGVSVNPIWELFDGSTIFVLRDGMDFEKSLVKLVESGADEQKINSGEYVANSLKSKSRVIDLSLSLNGESPKNMFNFSTIPTHIFHTNFLLDKIREDERDNIFVVGSDDRILEEISKNLAISENSENKKIADLYKFDMPCGVAIQELSTVVYAARTYERNFFEPGISKKRKSSVNNYETLNPGDLVVHQDYGISKLKKLEKITTGVGIRECFVLEFKDNDTLFVPLEDFYKITRYSYEQRAAVELDKLGSSTWNNRKEKLKERFKKLSEELISVYAKRQIGKREPIEHINCEMYRDFCASFPYELTEDQKKASKDIEGDLSSDMYMDRLICGDVGFGKTEIAMRAAFLSAINSIQVVLIAPTTILARQHHISFKKRMKNFALNIEFISRHTSAKKVKEIIENLANGAIDIIIGTHKLLSPNFRFKNIGLLVIDEEQRFGVSHKNKLLRYRNKIDVLSMSATPIPRTMSMSLGGIKDLSVIMTPPRERLPIETFIKVQSPELIKDACLKEINRGGQVFFVHNRIHDIENIKEKIASALPSARTAVIHGKLSGEEIENTIEKFLDKEYDILISTTIIENGIDMPNVNTIIIDDAHTYGLSQLYQLRGRVGRSNLQAWCYLLVPSKAVIEGEVKQRLTTMTHCTELGSGLNIAMRDLEIRGAGNLLGREQSGFIITVGFSMYFRLLKEVTDKIKNKQYISPHKVEFDASCSMGISQNYISDDKARATIYQRVSSFVEENDINEIEAELCDRFGSPDIDTLNFLRGVEMRIIASKKNISGVVISSDSRLFLRWDSEQDFDMMDFLKKTSNIKNNKEIKHESGITVVFELDNFIKNQAVWGEIKNILQSL